MDIFERVFGVVVQELHRTPPGGYQASDRGRWLGGENRMNGLPPPASSLLIRPATMHGGRYGTLPMPSFRYLSLRLPLSARESYPLAVPGHITPARVYPHADRTHFPAVANARSGKEVGHVLPNPWDSSAFHPVSNCAMINTADAGTSPLRRQTVVHIGEGERDDWIRKPPTCQIQFTLRLRQCILWQGR